MHLSKRALGFIEGQGPKQGRSHRSDWMHWDGLGEEQGMGLVEGLSVAVLDPGHRTPPTQGCPFPAGTCHYKPLETVPVVGAGGQCYSLVSLEMPLESEPWPFGYSPIIQQTETGLAYPGSVGYRPSGWGRSWCKHHL